MAQHGAHTGSIDLASFHVNQKGSSLLVRIPHHPSQESTNLGHGGQRARLPAAAVPLILSFEPAPRSSRRRDVASPRLSCIGALQVLNPAAPRLYAATTQSSSPPSRV